MSTALTPGQQIALETPDGRRITRLRVGLGWDAVPNAGIARSGARDVDLDASALQFAGSELFDLAFYNNLRTRDGSVVHQGDNTSGQGAQDDESIVIDLSSVYARVDTIVLLVSSYQGQSLTWVDSAYCRLVEEGDGSGTTGGGRRDRDRTAHADRGRRRDRTGDGHPRPGGRRGGVAPARPR